MYEEKIYRWNKEREGKKDKGKMGGKKENKVV